MDIQLKEKLIAKINSTNDDELLRQLLRVFNLESKTDECYSLSEKETDAVNEGIAQLDQGMFLSNEEANLQANQVLKKGDESE
ncbi:MAG: hypothetical protein V5804_09080 [Mucilaginibacter sp.]|uniref:hypothetical protein n=1 Tax=Mucilaginibacter sp. TaxID=1882438 RepID=UPI0034E4325B